MNAKEDIVVDLTMTPVAVKGELFGLLNERALHRIIFVPSKWLKGSWRKVVNLDQGMMDKIEEFHREYYIGRTPTSKSIEENALLNLRKSLL